MKLDQKTIRKIGAALALPRKALRKRAVAPSAAEPGAAKEVTPAICEKIRSGSDPSSAEHDSLPARLKLSPQSRKVFFTRNKAGHTKPVENCVGCGVSRNLILQWYVSENGNPTGSLCRCCRKAKSLKYKRDRQAEKAKEIAERAERATDVD